MKNQIALSLGIVAVGLLSVSATAALQSDRPTWESAVSSFADVDETQWGTGFSTFAAGSSITLPSGKTLSFDKDLMGAQVPTEWASWSGGQTPRVLYSVDLSVTGTFSAAVDSFGLEMEPNPFIDVSMTLELSDGSTLTQIVSGLGGAKFFGWTGQPVVSMTLSADTDFAFGRLVEGKSGTPTAPDAGATLALLGLSLGALLGLRRQLNG